MKIIVGLVIYASLFGGITSFKVKSFGLKTPSGLFLPDDKLYVFEYETGDIVIFDFSGKELNRILSKQNQASWALPWVLMEKFGL